jgi:thymidine kinase
MSRVKSYLYIIDFKDGDEKIMSKEGLEESVDDIFNEVSKIVKQYRLHSEPKKKYNMTLFTDEHNFTSEEYIEHYRNMPKEVWGDDFLEDFDIEIINMFN